MELAKIIERAMLDQGVKTNDHLSELSGVSGFKISALLRGEKSIKLSDLELITNSLKVSICYKPMTEWK